MPIFEYECSACGTVTEELVGVGSGQTKPRCEKCGSRRLRKLMSAASVQVKATQPTCDTTCAREHGCQAANFPCAAKAGAL